MLEKIDFKLKPIMIHREGDYILIKGKIFKEGTAILNNYGSNTRAPSL